MMNKIRILFVIAENRKRKDNKSPIFCRLTYKKKRKQFSTGIFTTTKCWDSKGQRIKPPDENYQNYNSQISLIKQRINQAFLFLEVNVQEFDVEDIYQHFSGEPSKEEKTVLLVFKEHNDRMEKLVGKDYKIGTFWKFRQARELLKEFIKHKYKRNDFSFKKLDLKFIQEYEFYLKTEKNLSQVTINKAIQRFRKIVKISLVENHLENDPFLEYKAKRLKKEIIYLTGSELFNLENHSFAQPRLKLVKDMFIFCCYTGLAFNEMVNLEKKHIINGFDNKLWIQMKREKTNRLISIPLLLKAEEILCEYQNEELIFPRISNQKFNSYLKEIADIVGIDKKLTHHIARKTFATTVLLYNDISMEIVSELLGHSNLTITQEHYGKVVQKKISEEIQKLNVKLNEKQGH